MPLADLSSLVVLSAIGSAWAQEDEDSDFKGEGWDVLTTTLIRDYGATVKTAEQVAAEWPVGRRIAPGRNFWVVDRKPFQRGGNIWGIVLICFGLADTSRPIKISINGGVDQQSFPEGGISVGPPYWPFNATPAKGSILESFPTMSVSYVLIGSLPPTENVGRVGSGYQTPPLNIAVRPTVWTYLANPTIHIPFGWTLMNMPADVRAGTDTPVSLVTEEWVYRRQFTP